MPLTAVPALIAGEFADRAIVDVAPPLLVSAPSTGLVPNGRLLALLPESENPAALPMSQKLTLVVVNDVPAKPSGAAPPGLVLPKTIEPVRLMEPVKLPSRA